MFGTQWIETTIIVALAFFVGLMIGKALFGKKGSGKDGEQPAEAEDETMQGVREDF